MFKANVEKENKNKKKISLGYSNNYVRIVDEQNDIYGLNMTEFGNAGFRSCTGSFAEGCMMLSMDPFEYGSYISHDGHVLRLVSDEGESLAEIKHENIRNHLIMNDLQYLFTNGGSQCFIWNIKQIKERVNSTRENFIPSIKKFSKRLNSFISIAQISRTDIIGTVSRGRRTRDKLFFNRYSLSKDQLIPSNFGLLRENGGKISEICSWNNSNSIFIGITRKTCPFVLGLDIRSERNSVCIKVGGDIRCVSELSVNDNYVFVACTEEKREQIPNPNPRTTFPTRRRKIGRNNWKRVRRFQGYGKTEVKSYPTYKRIGRSRVGCFDLRNPSKKVFMKYLPKILVKRVDSINLQKSSNSDERVLFLSCENHLVKYSPISGKRKTLVKCSAHIKQFCVSSYGSEKWNNNIMKYIDEGTRDLEERVSFLNHDFSEFMDCVELPNQRTIFFMNYMRIERL